MSVVVVLLLLPALQLPPQLLLLRTMQLARGLSTLLDNIHESVRCSTGAIAEHILYRWVHEIAINAH